MSEFIHGDCMDYLPQYPDNYFDLAIVDPPYGDAGGGFAGEERFGGRFDKYRNEGAPGDEVNKKNIAWDVAPGKEYFEQLFRVSRNQVIWGGNYFDLPPTRCFLIWRKLTISEKFSMAMAEYAWTSFNANAKVFEHVPQDPTGTRFHPTAKPVALYEWILGLYGKPGYKILDTHVGSASSLIACHRGGYEYVGYEIDEEYYRKANKRLEAETSQMTIFDMLNGGND